MKCGAVRVIVCVHGVGMKSYMMFVVRAARALLGTACALGGRRGCATCLQLARWPGAVQPRRVFGHRLPLRGGGIHFHGAAAVAGRGSGGLRRGARIPVSILLAAAAAVCCGDHGGGVVGGPWARVTALAAVAVGAAAIGAAVVTAAIVAARLVAALAVAGRVGVAAIVCRRDAEGGGGGRRGVAQLRMSHSGLSVAPSSHRIASPAGQASTPEPWLLPPPLPPLVRPSSPLLPPLGLCLAWWWWRRWWCRWWRWWWWWPGAWA